MPMKVLLKGEFLLKFWTDETRLLIVFWSPMYVVVWSVGLPHPFGIALFEDDIFWTDWHTKSIHSVNRLDADKSVHTVHGGLHYPMDIQVYHPQRQPTSRMLAAVSCVYMCEWGSEWVFLVDKSVHTVHGRLHYPMDIQVYHPQRQPASRMLAAVSCIYTFYFLLFTFTTGYSRSVKILVLATSDV